MPPKRMTANPLRPSRYRAGQAKGADVSSSDSDDSDSQEPPASASPVRPPPKAISARAIASNLGKVDLNARKQDAEASEALRLAAAKAERLAAEEGFVTEEEEDEDDGSGGGEEGDEDSEEESGSADESSEEEEAPRRPMMRPKFVPKSQRANAQDSQQHRREQEAAREAEEEARKKAADDLVEEQIRKDLAARAAGKKHWDDDENADSDVDTTDGLDPEAEVAAWRVRELKRLKRARTAIEEREAELAEVERRRNLTEEERKAEDDAFLAKQREDKESKGKMAYMQKYYHRGAFFQDETEAAGLLQRDIMGSRFADDVRNREVLPEYLQRRDMTKLGRKGATKYKDMQTEDTGRWGAFDDGRPRRGLRDGYGGDERFRPDEDDNSRLGDSRRPRGANMVPLGERKERRDDGARRSRDERGRGDDYRPGPADLGGGGNMDRRSDRPGDYDYDSRRRAASRSRSPRRERPDDHGKSARKRSTSRERYGHENDKRRRVDAS